MSTATTVAVPLCSLAKTELNRAPRATEGRKPDAEWETV